MNQIMQQREEEEIKEKNVKSNNLNNNGYKKEKDKKRSVLKKIIISLGILIMIGVTSLGILLYGPYDGFRNWLITTAMTTMNHQWIAYLFYSQDTINAVMASNKVEEINEDTDTNAIVVGVNSNEYENQYEEAILKKDNANDKYKIIEISGKGYSGYLAAINGGGFDDPNYSSNAANPLGVTYSRGRLITSYYYAGTGGIIGFDKNDKLVLASKCTEATAKSFNIRDCVTCGPFLIVNGKASTVVGNGGWGTAPRTAIGQRKDGIVLFLVLDGRTVKRPGADMDDLIEIMRNYGAYNAANLDGGTSTAMTVNYELINDPIDSTGAHKTRFVSTGFGLIEN